MEMLGHWGRVAHLFLQALLTLFQMPSFVQHFEGNYGTIPALVWKPSGVGTFVPVDAHLCCVFYSTVRYFGADAQLLGPCHNLQVLGT